MPVPILIIDSQGVLQYHNYQTEQIFGSRQLVPDNISKLSRSFSLEDFLQAISEHKQTPNEFFETIIYLEPYQLKKLYQLKMIVYPEDSQFYLITLISMMTNKRNESEKYTSLKKNFKELKQFARLGAMREISSLLADQLNQPLTAILSYTQAMQRLYQSNASSEEIHDAMERVVVNAEQAGQTIRNIRAQLNANTLQCQNSCINKLIQQSLQLTELNHIDSTIKLRTQYDPSNTSLCVDTIQFKYVILCLLHNALDAVSEASIKSPEINLSTHQDDLHYEIRIEDNGAGISKAVQGKLFEPFFTTKENGIGIGLSMCRHIIDLHSGNISITTKYSFDNKAAGTLVKIHLPCSIKEKTTTNH